MEERKEREKKKGQVHFVCSEMNSLLDTQLVRNIFSKRKR